jgi:hypothetical protein
MCSAFVLGSIGPFVVRLVDYTASNAFYFVMMKYISRQFVSIGPTFLEHSVVLTHVQVKHRKVIRFSVDKDKKILGSKTFWTAKAFVSIYTNDVVQLSVKVPFTTLLNMMKC